MSVTLHTDVGDIKIEVFCERTPKTCENFLALCASNYYSGCVFHRNIKGFMVQTGDPTGTGRGGNSIWGRKFEDEYSEYLKVQPCFRTSPLESGALGSPGVCRPTSLFSVFFCSPCTVSKRSQGGPSGHPGLPDEGARVSAYCDHHGVQPEVSPGCRVKSRATTSWSQGCL
ncbi:peptidyl-prolyl cis-trans isomerase-like 3 isoform X1 [Fukomys damarensis]|uniref:peptidyl-prolyl cis-trans isomerase-like 3 isoform X1 n=1 Tax=Fukomys damarensis TaxID=885580 RepID=UPI00053FE05A|nr:peptidyl-prolyl cis-trans isomerase-like 3 isoform X1 [Fukomys damarensis]XP_010615862.1 peptidyl-prolyl cis-trans isomerase-like 3 isoform X1 [Fukomys damarensis]XP_010615863.1 peptidyl-prolyl cis-trans isomerase-like 3 isoform X1 [Fukomys damarensis]XP_010615864.1 peptidyl-prolyl cis-trans isomerase-like 3 isoform X1 [Fukomys damarensis]